MVFKGPDHLAQHRPVPVLRESPLGIAADGMHWLCGYDMDTCARSNFDKIRAGVCVDTAMDMTKLALQRDAQAISGGLAIDARI